MGKVALPATLASALAEAKDPQHCTCDDAKDLLTPVLALVASEMAQLAAFRGKLFVAEMEAPDTDGHTERMHSTAKSQEKAIQTLMEAARLIWQNKKQFARYAAEIEKEYAPCETAPLPVPVGMGGE